MQRARVVLAALVLEAPGRVVKLQFCYRDPQNTSNVNTSFSGALEYRLCP